MSEPTKISDGDFSGPNSLSSRMLSIVQEADSSNLSKVSLAIPKKAIWSNKFFSLFVVMLSAGAILTFCLLLRINQNLNNRAVASVLKAESYFETSFPELKGYLGTNLSLNTQQLFRAVLEGDISKTKILLSAGASPNTKDGSGKTVLLEAVNKGESEIALLLLEQGADFSYSFNQNTNLLIPAVSLGDTAVIKKLIAAGADLNIQNENGISPLILAAMMDNVALIKLLLEAGADTSVKDARGKTAFGYASGASKQVLKLKENKVLKKHSGIKKPTKKSSGKLGRAKLKFTGKPEGVFRRGKLIRVKRDVHLEYVKVNIRNPSKVEAKNIKVQVWVTGRTSLDLTGPKNLGPGKKSTWVWTGKIDVTNFYKPSEENLSAKLSCDNCQVSD